MLLPQFPFFLVFENELPTDDKIGVDIQLKLNLVVVLVSLHSQQYEKK